MTSDHLTDLEDIARQLQAPDLTRGAAARLRMDRDDAIHRAIHAGHTPEGVAAAAGVQLNHLARLRGVRL